MGSRLSEAVARLHLAANESSDSIDEKLFAKVPRKRQKHTAETVKAGLEMKYLAASTSFSTEWLDRLQQRWQRSDDDRASLFCIGPTQSRTKTRFVRRGLEGRVVGYKDTTAAKPKAPSRRRHADGDGVDVEAGLRGGAAAATNTLERVMAPGNKDGLLEVAPGMRRGIMLDTNTMRDNDCLAPATPEVSEEAGVADGDGDWPSSGDAEAGEAGRAGEAGEYDHDVDALLPVEFPALQARGRLGDARARPAGREWAHMVELDSDMACFAELMPDMAREWPFELDAFQKQAIYHLEQGDSVFVAAHTSAGKTVVAEYAIALAAKHMTKAIYTSPIKALSNQKFRDFGQVFAEVGILTGDVQVQPEASCLVMTTEILRSMLYRGADVLRDVEFVIFDEVHYVNDSERGVVWEEAIIMLPKHVALVLLSATVPNTYEFASWVGRTTKRDVYVISTPTRPVPLEHHLWAGGRMHKLLDANKTFLDSGWKRADDALRGRSTGGEAAGRRGRGGAGRGGVAGRGGGARRIGWVQMVQELTKQGQLPACVFVFSKKRCDANADELGSQDLCTRPEKSKIHAQAERAVARLAPDDRALPQLVRLRQLLSRGIGVHHGGLLPIAKELVELLFAQGLVKVLFATETFAVGLNLPTRTVVFAGLRKHDGQAFRALLPGEYTQMAGRAGRRGLDTVGTVILAPPPADAAPPARDLRHMLLGQPAPLRSRFRLTYAMMLKLLRAEALGVEDMLRRSFSEHATQLLLPAREEAVKLSEADLARLRRDACHICDAHLDACHQAAELYKELTAQLYRGLCALVAGRKLFARGRLVVWSKHGVRTPGILLADAASPTLRLVELPTHRAARDDADILPVLPAFRRFFTPLRASGPPFVTCHTSVADVVCLARLLPKHVLPAILAGGDGLAAAADSLWRLCQSWGSSVWDEADMGFIDSLPMHQLLHMRAAAATAASQSPALACPSFPKHFALRHDQWLVQTELDRRRQALSDQSLQLLPDYEQRIRVLGDLGCVDDAHRIQLKGRVACEMHSGHELLLTELILDNVLAEFEPAEIAALLSALVFHDKTERPPRLTARLDKGKNIMCAMAEKVHDVEVLHQVVPAPDAKQDEAGCSLNFALVEVVYEWARGMSFRNITGLTDVLEGTIVRTITRLHETCAEVRNAAKTVGDQDLFRKMVTAQEMIRRDITAVASLYM